MDFGRSCGPTWSKPSSTCQCANLLFDGKPITRLGQHGGELERPLDPFRTSARAVRADKAGLDVGQPDVVSPAIGAETSPVTAAVIRTIDQDAAHAGRAHFSESDLLRRRVRAGMAHDCADLTDREAATAWGRAACAHMIMAPKKPEKSNVYR
jgi:hypothetical protein